MDEKQKILEAYIATVSEAPLSDKHGMVQSEAGQAILFINKVNNMLKKKEPHWPDIVMHLKKAEATLKKAQKAAK